MSVTIRDVAQALNINPSTVSSCLSGEHRKRRISDARAAEVRKKAEELGYIPNRLAGRIFGRNNKKNIALIFKYDTAGARNLPVLEYAIRFLGERRDCDFSVIYSRSGDLTEAIRNGLGLGIRDFVVIGYLRGQDLAQVDFAKLPEVRLYIADYFFDSSDMEIPSVACKIGFDRDIFYKKLTQVLNSAGLGPVITAHSLEPGQSGQENLKELRYHVDGIKDLFQFGAEKLAPEVLQKARNGKCRSILLRNDSITVGVVDALLKSGLHIPEDIAVIGFNNSPFTAYCKLPLTTVELPVRDNMKKILAHLLDGKKLDRIIHINPKIVVRDTTPKQVADILNHFESGQ